ncbi:MAG: ABC transporter permease subunit [Acidimicrobiales bacterium]|jgi:putative spermidine/putrescine transport system permease protein
MAQMSAPSSATLRRLRRARNRAPFSHVVLLVLGAVFFLLPIYSIVQFSLQGTQGTNPFHWYLTVFDDPSFRSSFWLSVQISLETVAASLVLLVPTVFWVHLRLPKLRPVMDLVSVIPFVVPPIVLIVGLAPFLKSFSSWLFVRPEVLALIYVVFALPFMYRALDAGMRAIDLKTLTEAAESLGASTARTLFRVILPNLRTAIIGGSLLTVAIAMGEFTIASLMGFSTFAVYTYNVGTSTAYEGVTLAFISFLLVWGAMLALYLLGRGGRSAAGVAIKD